MKQPVDINKVTEDAIIQQVNASKQKYIEDNKLREEATPEQINEKELIKTITSNINVSQNFIDNQSFSLTQDEEKKMTEYNDMIEKVTKAAEESKIKQQEMELYKNRDKTFMAAFEELYRKGGSINNPLDVISAAIKGTVYATNTENSVYEGFVLGVSGLLDMSQNFGNEAMITAMTYGDIADLRPSEILPDETTAINLLNNEKTIRIISKLQSLGDNKIAY